MSTPPKADRNGAPELPEPPWWRHPMVWLVICGPAVVVLASMATMVIAVRGADPVLDTRATAQPAVQARNHAAQPLPRP
jgi:uncharacterized protein